MMFKTIPFPHPDNCQCSTCKFYRDKKIESDVSELWEQVQPVEKTTIEKPVAKKKIKKQSNVTV